EDPAFPRFFRAATPIGELSELRLGSRPAARGRGAGASRAGSGVEDVSTSWMEHLRAIPWVFAWSQSRLNLPGWFGLGSALVDLRERAGASGLERLADLYRRWPFVTSVLDNAELSLAKTDLAVARRYASLADGPDARRIWSPVEA